MSLEGLLVADRYLLERQLGEGGMGSVWVAQHVGLETKCAVKFIRADCHAGAESLARFEREAKAAARLSSRHVVQMFDYGSSEIGPYIAMELLEGEDLAARLDRQRRLGADETVEILSQVASALSKAQAQGLVHRDLKPENVFLARDDDQVTVKVLDFGIAKTLGPDPLESRTLTGAVLGTPAYMSPEQAQGARAVDHRADLWSLAVIAFLCLTGEHPFVAETFGDLLLKIVVQPLPVPSEVWPDAPPGLDAWWAKAADRDPARRYQSARELVTALAAALRTEAPTAVSTPPLAASIPPPSAPTVAATVPSRPSICPVAPLSRTVIEAPPPEQRRRAVGMIAGAVAAAAVAFIALAAALGSGPSGETAQRTQALATIPAPAPPATSPPAATASAPVVAPEPEDPAPPVARAKPRPLPRPAIPRKKPYDPGFR